MQPRPNITRTQELNDSWGSFHASHNGHQISPAEDFLAAEREIKLPSLSLSIVSVNAHRRGYYKLSRDLI